MLSETIAQDWDAIIIGTGMGGSVLGYALARSGLRVLFLEKGRSHFRRSALRGDFAENFFPTLEAAQAKHREFLARAGRCAEEIEDVSNGRPRRFVPFIGSGTGGSTALYGMALERFFPCDFTPRQNYPKASNSSLPESWPISYQQLVPYYEAAERVFRVRGTADPLRPAGSFPHYLRPPVLNPGNRELANFFQAKGLHPYQLPMACEYERGDDRCQGFLDARGCKNDAARICLQPALERHGAQLLDECEAVRLEPERTAVRRVISQRHGQTLRLEAKVVVLAAGSLATPGLLLRSKSTHWPNGLANRSGLVGCNLMRHLVDLYVVYPQNPGPYPGNVKQLAFNDFYHLDGEKFGTVQSFGDMVPASLLVAGLEKDLRAGPAFWAMPLLRLARPIVRAALGRMFSRGLVLASILEDLPYRNNQVRPGQDRTTLQYQLGPHDRCRIEAFRRRLAETLQPYAYRLIKQAENNERIAHACGTCRFGTDPQKSVLDPNNRAHGLDNLYVVDASFFPSSGGTNLSLTIAANALRVAEHVADRLGARRPDCVGINETTEVSHACVGQ